MVMGRGGDYGSSFNHQLMVRVTGKERSQLVGVRGVNANGSTGGKCEPPVIVPIVSGL